jgi:hypothetical protein
MPITYPATLDSLPNPTAADQMDAPGLEHDVQHDNANDAIEALEAKVGVDNSGVSSSLDYKSRKGSFIRTTAQVATDAIASGATDSTQVLSIGKACMMVKLETDFPAWVRIYSSLAAQSADAARTRSTDPIAGSGVLLEVITVTGTLAVGLSPGAMAYSLEASPGTTLHITVTNDDVSSRAITVTVTLVPIEG